MKLNRKARALGALPVVVALGACDLLTIKDPGRYDDGDLDDALDAVANTVEGSAHDWADYYVVWQELLGDTYMHTGNYQTTLALPDEGRVGYATFPSAGYFNFPDQMSKHRWFARRSFERLNRVLEDSASSDVRLVQVLMGDALLDMYLGLFSCEGVLEASPSPMFADIQIYDKAAETFGRVVEAADNVDPEVLEDWPDYINAARTGRALMLMLSGDYEGAASEAATVPDGFEYEAIQSTTSFTQYNYVHLYTINRSTGMMPWLWERIDQTAGKSYIRDRWTNEFDERMPVWFRNYLGADGETPHYAQQKYVGYGDDIPILHSGHARLIEAEVKVMANDFAGATTILNSLRGQVSLAPVGVPTNMEDMMDLLREERFAELFMEGMRIVDLHRFRLVLERFEGFDDPLRRGVGRATKFAGSQREAQLNPEVVDDSGIRCQPAA
jgi:hypothetical protein